MKAFKLINIKDGRCTFLEGEIPSLTKVPAHYFFVQSNIEDYQLRPHPAPRNQFVITLKGKLKFTVSDGSSFMVEPGIILIASDIEGKGHSWELIEGTSWERIYIVHDSEVEDHFMVDAK